jgi:hypothetical protein
MSHLASLSKPLAAQKYPSYGEYSVVRCPKLCQVEVPKGIKIDKFALWVLPLN